MRRQQRPVEVRLAATEVGTAGQLLKEHANEAPNEPRLGVRVRADGRVRARFVASSRYSMPPLLVGRIAAEPDGAVLAATIHESSVEVFVPRLFVGLAAFLAVVLAGLLSAAEFTSPGVYVCGFGGAVLALLGYGLGRLRRASFRRQADRLEEAVRAAALSGSGRTGAASAEG
jgi:hypothetical protein